MLLWFNLLVMVFGNRYFPRSYFIYYFFQSTVYNVFPTPTTFSDLETACLKFYSECYNTILSLIAPTEDIWNQHLEWKTKMCCAAANDTVSLSLWGQDLLFVWPKFLHFLTFSTWGENNVRKEQEQMSSYQANLFVFQMSRFCLLMFQSRPLKHPVPDCLNKRQRFLI